MGPSIIITGANGQLGRSLQRECASRGYTEVVSVDLPELDITDRERVRRFLDSNPCDYLINCAAYTAVDKAESEAEREHAFSINAVAPGILGKEANERGIKIIHISTDYVFTGKAITPYHPDNIHDLVNENGANSTVYGLSKLKGEKALLKEAPNSVIIRTSWLYSEFGNNFVKTMIRLALNGISPSVVNDQTGSPTYAGDLANTIVEIIAQGAQESGIFHFCNEGAINWYEFSCRIFEEVGKGSANVIPTSSKNYPSIAERPKYSVLDTTKIKRFYDVNIPKWDESLHNAFDKIKQAVLEETNGY